MSMRRVRVGLVVIAIAVVAGVVTGCGDEKPRAQEERRGGHVWKGMTDTIPTARDVARDANSAQGAQEAAIERARRGD
jgi:hypothetical protein